MKQEYCTCPTASADGSFDVTYETNASASFPVISNSPMWVTSNRPAPRRTVLCSAVIPSGYCTGIS